MPSILIVDDNPVEQKFAGRLLLTDSDATLEFASDGVEALDCMAARPFDLVLTDLRMPRMDGLDLLDAIRQNFVNVPVILMTADGSEVLAVEALRRGAANYVRKMDLSRDLVRICENVLDLSREQKDRATLIECTVRGEIEFELSNDRILASKLARYLQESASRLMLCDASQRTQIGVALEEALLNSVIHGNLEVSSELRERNDDSFVDLIHDRQQQTPYRDRRVHVTYQWSERELRFVIRDQGPGFNLAALPDPTDPENLIKASGRGILLMRSFMDQVEYTSTGNQVTMVKYATAITPSDRHRAALQVEAMPV